MNATVVSTGTGGPALLTATLEELDPGSIWVAGPARGQAIDRGDRNGVNGCGTVLGLLTHADTGAAGIGVEVCPAGSDEDLHQLRVTPAPDRKKPPEAKRVTTAFGGLRADVAVEAGTRKQCYCTSCRGCSGPGEADDLDGPGMVLVPRGEHSSAPSTKL